MAGSADPSAPSVTRDSAPAAPRCFGMNAATTKLLRGPAIKEQFASQGLEPTPTSPAEAAAYLRSEVAKWAKVIKAANVRAD